MAAPKVVLVGVAVAGIAVMSGCQAHASVSASLGAPSVSKSDVEHQIATTLAAQKNQPIPKVVCPGDLAAKIGTTMKCQLTPQHSTDVDPVTIRVTSVTNDVAHFHISVGSPTSP